MPVSYTHLPPAKRRNAVGLIKRNKAMVVRISTSARRSIFSNGVPGIYCRLSVEDMKEDKKGGKEDVSNSIQNQKMILLQYAKENRFANPTFFVDDGYSGTNYDRPGFQAMLAEIEAGRVAVCCTKDLSRLGRNSSLTGLCLLYTSRCV